MSIPGFAAERSLFRSTGQAVAFDEGEFNSGIWPAERVPGGPSTVPSGYGRKCVRVPYTICVGNRCWIEYGWACTYYPLPRAQ
jgi:hypothetical protein